MLQRRVLNDPAAKNCSLGSVIPCKTGVSKTMRPRRNQHTEIN